MISHEHRCIFIHIPKTGGTSVEKKLGLFDVERRGVQDHRSIREIEPLSLAYLRSAQRQGRLGLLVKKAKHRVKRRTSVNARQYREYLKFTMVRNPWARVFSWYQNVIRDELHRAEQRVAADCTFDEFLDHHLEQWALNPQLFWLEDSRGKMAMDFVGKLETLQADFDRVAKRLNLEDTSLPRLIKGGGQNYVDFYTDRTRNLVAKKYREEIDCFGYRFGA